MALVTFQIIAGNNLQHILHADHKLKYLPNYEQG